MAQSIASPQENVATEKQLSDDSNSRPSSPWSAVAAAGSVLAGMFWRLRSTIGFSNTNILDVDRISARLNVKSRAETEGRNNQPDSTEERMSGTQREIVVHFKELHRKSRRRVTELDEKLRQLASNIDIQAVGSSIRDIAPRCENRALRLIAESQSQLNLFAQQEQQQQKILQEMGEKKEQKPRTDQPISPFIQLIFLASLIVVGALVIAKVTVSGFGAEHFALPSWAIAVSLTVVLVSFVLARIISSPVFHSEEFMRSTHLLGKCLGYALIAVTAIMVTYYTVAVTTDPATSVRSIVDLVVADPTRFQTELIDWKVFWIVTAIGSLSFLISYRHDSSHPNQVSGSGDVFRARRKRDRLSKRLRAQINAIIDSADAEVTELSVRLRGQVSEYSKLMEEAKRMPAILEDYDVALEDGCGMLLDRYRSINVEARDSDAPASFSEHVCFRSDLDGNSSANDDRIVQLEQFQAGLVEIEQDMVEVRRQLRDLNARGISTIEDFATPPT